MKKDNLMILNKLAEVKVEEINEDSIIYISDADEAVRILDIQVLDLSHTRIKDLPDTIGCLMGLEYLNVSHTQLITLPESIGNLTRLQSLYVNDTQLITLPKSIGSLTGLEYLNISHTQLTTLPESIGNLTRLQSLNVSSTQLTTLPESIGNLTRLQSLDANDTRLTTLPESIGEMISTLFYDGYLKNGRDEDSIDPLSWITYTPTQQWPTTQEENSEKPRIFNKDECIIIVDLVTEIQNSRPEITIGIITPHTSQPETAINPL